MYKFYTILHDSANIPSLGTFTCFYCIVRCNRIKPLVWLCNALFEVLLNGHRKCWKLMFIHYHISYNFRSVFISSRFVVSRFLLLDVYFVRNFKGWDSTNFLVLSIINKWAFYMCINKKLLINSH